MSMLDETLRRHRVSVLGPANSKFKIKLIDRLDEKKQTIKIMPQSILSTPI
jgi:hypothetical protein